MYIELFIADNWMMDVLMLRLACALCGAKPRLLRIVAFGFAGAAAAILSLVWAPLQSLWGKLVIAAVMALGVPFTDLKGFLRSAAAMFTVSFTVGGLAVALNGGSGVFADGSLLRITMAAGVVLCFAPNILRHFRMKRPSVKLDLLIRIKGEEKSLKGLYDTGAALYEPISGRPVIAVYAPELMDEKGMPVPASTVNGSFMLTALEPDVLLINGRPSCALIAPVENKLKNTDAIVPAGIFGEVV